MQKRRRAILTGVATAISICFFSTINIFASPSLLLKGMRGESVTVLQNNLKKLGYFGGKATGYYGSVTEASVRKLQKQYGYLQDGKAGRKTLALIDSQLGKAKKENLSARGTSVRTSTVLKKGMRGEAVTTLQKNLKKLGYFKVNPTGYYGSITKDSVIRLQKRYGCVADGIAGKVTLGLINQLLSGKKATASTSNRGGTAQRPAANNSNYMMPWFGGAENVLSIGKTATVHDINTGISFKIKRTYGHNHADCETLTAEDTRKMKRIYGGQWSWSRRAVIVDIDGVKIAASMAGMPHAGIDRAEANAYISSRSGGYGRGTNLDGVKRNSMNGVFDLHFYRSRTHGSNRVDTAHQNMVKKAADWARKNY